ncbi:unnamed protein product [Paramecium octaurelia]|uniref:Uncharacterized protein n=1 Tax=Paramecium octaurelia TaxID=43137 RepID=A0A8S1W6V5_PAROT|nr:unnamed protein product [Paramecium octaurelia]
MFAFYSDLIDKSYCPFPKLGPSQSYVNDVNTHKQNIKQYKIPSKKYNVITDEQRNSLIKMITEDGISIKNASEKCSIKLSTAKAILKVFKTSGRVGKKQCRQRKAGTKRKIGNGRVDLMMEIRKRLPKIGFNQYLCFATQQQFGKPVKEEQDNFQFESIEYPEDDESFVESDDSELNPFLFELDQQKSKDERVEMMYQALLKNRDKILEVISDANHNLKKLRKYASVLQKEHQIFNILKKAYEDLKHKTINHDQFVTSLEKAYEKQIQELTNDTQELHQQLAQQQQEFEKQACVYKEQLAQKQELLTLKEQEIICIKNNELQLSDKLKNSQADLVKLQKETNAIKKIKTSNFLNLNEKSDFPFSTFELIIATKIKTQLISFLSSKDIVNLCLSKKSIYFALCQFKLVIPQVIRCSTIQYQSQMKLLTKQVDLFKKLSNDCPELVVKTQIIKYFDAFLNPNEWLDPIIVEANNFVKGTQFLGRLEHIENPDSTDGLKTFVQSMASRSQQTANLLKSDPFNLSQFTANLIVNANDREAFQKERQNQLKKLKTSQSDVQEKIFNLGTVVAADVGLFGLYLATMQRIFASLYVFGSYINIECRSQSSLIYYLVEQHWQLIQKQTILEQMIQDRQQRIQNNNNEIKALNEQTKGLQDLIKTLQASIKAHKIETENEQSEKAKIKQELQETKQLLFSYGKNIKLLALEIRELRKVNKEIVMQNNKAASQISDLKSQVASIQV